LSIPEGKVVGLVGPNGAGKTTLLSLAVGLLTPTRGSITVLAGRPGDGPAQLEKVGFVAQDTPAYAGLSVGKHLLMGAYLNANWDQELARDRIDQLGLDPRQKAGSLSGGQRAQLALTMAIAKQPELLLLDEPLASLDPLARREFLQGLMEIVASHGISVMLSSHLIADLNGSATTWSSSSPHISSWPARSLSCSRHITACPVPAGSHAPCPPATRSSNRATPISRAPSSYARTSRFSIRHGPSGRSR
jgi:ABC-type multidrug transport system, ATPase component